MKLKFFYSNIMIFLKLMTLIYAYNQDKLNCRITVWLKKTLSSFQLNSILLFLLKENYNQFQTKGIEVV